MKFLDVFTVILFLGLFSGCTIMSKTTIPLDEEMNKYRGSQAYNVGRLEPVHNQINVRLVCPEICGCYVEKVEEEAEKAEKGFWKCIGMPFNMENPKDEMKQMLQDAGIKNKSVYFFSPFSDVTEEILFTSLSSYYRKVNIDLTDSKDKPGVLESEVMMDYYSAKSDKRIFIKILALNDVGDVLFDVNGSAANHMGYGYLGWYIPLAVLTFPIGTAIGSVVVENVNNAILNKTVIEAIDDATRKFTEKSLEFTANGMTTFDLLVLVE